MSIGAKKMTLPVYLKTWIAAACVAVGMGTVQAADLPSTSGPYAYYADRVPIRKVLQDFCAAIGATLKMDADVSATINGRLNAASGKEFLDRLTANHGLSWYYNGGTLHIAKLTAQQTKSFPVSAGSIGGLKQALKELGVLDDRFGWAELIDQGLVIVSGPPDYVQVIGKTITSLPLAPSGQQQVFVFRLKHASVEDRTIFYRDKQRTVVGIATILKSLIGAPGPLGATPSAGAEQLVATGIVAPLPSALSNFSLPSLLSPLPSPLPRSQNSAGDTPRSLREPSSGKTKATGGGSDTGNKSAFDAGAGASIEADTRLNAIIVKDAPERFPMYQKLIAMLDVPVPMIEIEARIIDVNKKRVSELGFDWGAASNNAAFTFGDPTRAPGLSDLALGIRARVASNTVVLDGASYLLARIRALETVGDARTVSRPSILTTDNLGALIDLSQTFYTSVSGERVANLVPVTVGTMLKVTPHMIEKDGERHIQMVVDIEDGTLVTRPGLSLPVVQKSTIATQAVILENQSLLIGGYSSENTQDQELRIPLLSDIPVLGRLFISTQRDTNKLDRLFLITPRIVDPAALAKAVTTALPLPLPLPDAPPASAPLPTATPDDTPLTPPAEALPFSTSGLKLTSNLNLTSVADISTAVALQEVSSGAGSGRDELIEALTMALPATLPASAPLTLAYEFSANAMKLTNFLGPMKTADVSAAIALHEAATGSDRQRARAASLNQRTKRDEQWSQEFAR